MQIPTKDPFEECHKYSWMKFKVLLVTRRRMVSSVMTSKYQMRIQILFMLTPLNQMIKTKKGMLLVRNNKRRNF